MFLIGASKYLLVPVHAAINQCTSAQNCSLGILRTWMWFVSLVHMMGSDFLTSLHCNCTELHPFEKEVTRQQRKHLPVSLLQLLHFLAHWDLRKEEIALPE